MCAAEPIGDHPSRVGHQQATLLRVRVRGPASVRAIGLLGYRAIGLSGYRAIGLLGYWAMAKGRVCLPTPPDAPLIYIDNATAI